MHDGDYSGTPGFAAAYLETFYAQEPTRLDWLDTEFLVRRYARMGPVSSFLELGCGPTVFHVIPVTPYTERIYMADYLAENLAAVRSWKEAALPAFDWDRHIRHTLAVEGNRRETVADRAASLRARIAELWRCDLRSDLPLGRPMTFPAVGCFYTVDVISTCKAEWHRIMARVASLVASGGYLFLMTLRDMTSYEVRHPSGRTDRFPLLSLTEADFEAVLPGLGFDMRETEIESHPFVPPLDDGLRGAILIAAKKKQAPDANLAAF
jgi:hypothetical protein